MYGGGPNLEQPSPNKQEISAVLGECCRVEYVIIHTYSLNTLRPQLCEVISWQLRRYTNKHEAYKLDVHLQKLLMCYVLRYISLFTRQLMLRATLQSNIYTYTLYVVSYRTGIRRKNIVKKLDRERARMIICYGRMNIYIISRGHK